MKRVGLGILAMMLIVVAFHLSQMMAMASFVSRGATIGTHMVEPQCPMGFICPLRLGNTDLAFGLSSVAKTTAPGLLAFIFFGLLCFVASRGGTEGYSPPAFVYANTGSRLSRITVKRE